MVMLAIGDSLARGLGAFGALAIIRFRTRIQDPRNILFIFASLSVGLAIGVFGYTIAFSGTILFCLGALFLHYSPFSSKVGLNGRLNFQLSDTSKLSSVLEIMEKYCSSFADVEVISRPTGRFEFEYLITLDLEADNTTFLTELGKVESIGRVRISFKNIQEDN